MSYPRIPVLMRCPHCDVEWEDLANCWLCAREGISGRDESTQSNPNTYSCKFTATTTVDTIGMARDGVA